MPLAVSYYQGNFKIEQAIADSPGILSLSQWHWGNILSYPLWLVRTQLLPIALALGIAGCIIGLVKKDRGVVFFLFSAMASYSLLTLLNYNFSVANAIYWIPAFCVFAAIPLDYFKTRNIKLMYGLLIAIAILFNIHESLYTVHAIS